ncbi:tetratricopeptide repeat protein [candidate division KSB1 bacterium]|nr:tetratricopeptide repeat protein [candidate division KSB1 bacterium]
MEWIGRATIVLLILALMLGCGAKMTEEQLRAKALEYENSEQWDEAIAAYEKLIKYKDSPVRDAALYKLGMLYANHRKDFEKSINAYSRVMSEYPESEHAVKANFMVGYEYANHVQDLEKAREAYSDFLARYPDHELAASVKWELDNLGKDISEIDLNFEGSLQTDN